MESLGDARLRRDDRERYASAALYMAGFQVIMYGLFWVFTEEYSGRILLRLESKVGRTLRLPTSPI